LSSIALPGTEFTVTKQPTLPVTLSSLGSARIELCFTPRADGTHHDSLVFLSNASNAPRVSVLLGVTDKPYLTLAPALIAFGYVGYTEFRDSAFTVTNVGGMNDSILVTLDPVNIVPDTAISVSPTAFVLAAGGSQAITVHVRPRLLAAPSIYYYAQIQINSRFSTATPQILGNVTFDNVTGVSTVEGPPVQFALEQNFPNPFNPSTTIRYGLPHKTVVQLTVYNTLGQQITVLQNGEQDAGFYEVRFEGSGLSSGVYLYRMQAGSFVETRRLLLIR